MLQALFFPQQPAQPLLPTTFVAKWTWFGWNFQDTVILFTDLFFPREIDLRGEVGLWTDPACLLLLFVSRLVGSVCFFSLYFLIVSLFSFRRSSMFGSLCFFPSHDHILPLLHDLLSLPLLIFGILSFLTDSVLIIVFHFNTDSIYFYLSRWIKILWASL